MAKVENETSKAIVRYLTMLGWMAWRNGNQGVKGRANVTKKGISDIIALKPGEPSWWIEVKNPCRRDGRSGKLSEAQIGFQRDILAAGHVYVLAYTIDDVIEALEKRS